ncbi:MAG: hypothetical protein Alpg2KO_14850 [Alphaproteobacteria bacterium]
MADGARQGDRLFICGLTHQNCPPDLSAALFREPQAYPDILRWLQQGPLQGALWLGTCNRLQLVGELAADDTSSAPVAEIQDAMARFCGLGPHGASHLSPWWQMETGPAVTRRLCRVAASLDSARVGEPFIAAQMADAWRMAKRGGLAGDQLAKAMQTALDFARHCHVEIGLCDHPTDLTSALLMELGTRFHGLRGIVVGLSGWSEDAPPILQALRQEGAVCTMPAAATSPPAARGMLSAMPEQQVSIWLDMDGAAPALPGQPVLDLRKDGPDHTRLNGRASKGKTRLAHAIAQAEHSLNHLINGESGAPDGT